MDGGVPEGVVVENKEQKTEVEGCSTDKERGRTRRVTLVTSMG